MVADGERSQTVDLVAPQVDADGFVRRRGKHVDDATAHRELTAVLDLVLAPVPAGDQLGEERIELELVAGPHHHGRGDAQRAEPLEQRAHRRDDHPWRREHAVTCSGQRIEDGQAPPHRLDLGADALEGQRLPCREHHHRTAERPDDTGLVGLGRGDEAGEVVADALGIEPGGGDDDQGGALGEGRQCGDDHRLGCFGDGDGGISRADDCGQDGIGPQQVRHGGQRAGGSSRHGVRGGGRHLGAIRSGSA